VKQSQQQINAETKAAAARPKAALPKSSAQDDG
jgi:hypothetical protein